MFYNLSLQKHVKVKSRQTKTTDFKFTLNLVILNSNNKPHSLLKFCSSLKKSRGEQAIKTFIILAISFLLIYKLSSVYRRGYYPSGTNLGKQH